MAPREHGFCIAIFLNQVKPKSSRCLYRVCIFARIFAGALRSGTRHLACRRQAGSLATWVPGSADGHLGQEWNRVLSGNQPANDLINLGRFDLRRGDCRWLVAKEEWPI